MLEGIPLGLSELGPGALLIVVVALVLLGLYRRKLVPEKDLLDAREETRSWRAAYEKEHEARRESDQQVGDLVTAVAESNELGRTSLAILRALRDKQADAQ